MPSSSTSGTRRALPVAGLVMAAWALLPPYTGPPLNTDTRVEVADHVVPGILLVAVSMAALALGGRTLVPPKLFFSSGFVVLSSGIWMTATHVPLVAQATRGEVTLEAAAYHTAPGVAVVILGLVWLAVHVWDAPS